MAARPHARRGVQIPHPRSYSVSERRREIGIRAALGATRGRLIRLVLGQGLGFTLAGLALGLLAAAATSRQLSTLLFGVTPSTASPSLSRRPC